jgi:hypothetical protein
MSVHYLYSVDLPLSHKKIIYRELHSKDQISLCKAMAMLPCKTGYYEDFGRVLKQIVLGCIENKSDFENINLIDYILFLTKLRCISIGDSIELSFKNEEDSEENVKEEEKIVSLKITLFLNKFLSNLYEISKDTFKDTLFSKDNNIFIKLNWPSIKFESNFLSLNDNSDPAIFLNTLGLFLDEVSIGDKIFYPRDWSFIEIKDFYDSLPIDLTNAIQREVLNVAKTLNLSNLFNLPEEKKIPLNFYDASYQVILRLFFSDNLQYIYEEYFLLAERNISPEYIDNQTIAERKLYFSLLEKERKHSSGKSSIPLI